MRISDWSSDVCSSDLVPRLNCRHWAVTMSGAMIAALASQCAPNVAPQTVAAIVRTESHGRPFALNVNGSTQPPRQSNAASAVATAQRYIAAGYSRSEEPTSEHQSLMRISYAVFCLKKKKLH